MKQILLIIFIAYSTFIYGQVNSEKVNINQNGNSLKLISSSDDGLIIELQVVNFLKVPVEINGETYFSVNLLEESLIKEKGNPELPKFTRSILIPGTSNFSANIISGEYEDIILPVKPSKGILSRTVNPNDIPYVFSSIYSNDIFYPTDRYSFNEPYLIRDSRGVAINIYPFAYNPKKKTLRIFTKLEIEISFSGSNLKNSTQGSMGSNNTYFEPILKNHFLNYEAESNLESTRTVEETGRMLIICDNDFIDEMQQFVNHKINRGLSTEIVSMDDVGTTANDVANYIQNEYDDDNSLTFVLLIGDNAQVPTLTVSGGGSDPSFSLVSGDDNYPDIIIGRFSAENESQVETMVTRSIFYENMTEQNWFHAGIGIASDDGSGNGDDNEYDWEHLRNIRTDLLNYHYITISELYDGSQGGEDASGNPTASMVSDLVNNGVSIINYTGHGSTTSWTTSGFSNTNVSSLTNDDMLPFIFSVACVNGNFTNNTCFAESWLRATNSSTSKPTGAIGFYASSINQDWSPPMEAQDEFNNLLIIEDYITFGALCYNGSCSMMDEYGAGNGQSGANMFLTWHIFGDPSINTIPNIQGDCPENLTITESISGATHGFLASNTITASNTISNGAQVYYGANGSIILLPGFSVELGCSFTADINGCNQNPLESTFVDAIDNTNSQDIENPKLQEVQPELLEKNLEEPIVKLYPNPMLNGQSQIEIIYSEKPQSLFIFNSLGNIIYSDNNPDKTTTISNINEKGLIFIKINFKDSFVVKKIISK